MEETESYELQWPGKAAALLVANEPPNTSFEYNIDIANNIFIEGDNLDALKLLQSVYQNKIKLIYIDPPYNTRNAYSYNDDFAGHASWLSMMYPRLVLAKSLLAPNGLIFISINDVELADLTHICNEIYGAANHLNTIIWHYGKMSNEHHRLPNNHEYILVCRKTAAGEITNNVKKEDSEYRNRYLRYLTKENTVTYGRVKNSTDHLIELRCKKVAKELGKTQLDDDDILFDFNKEFKAHSDVIYVPHLKGNSGERIAEFGTGQKPLALLDLVLKFGASEPDSLVLDFFAGSGTTGEAVLRLNAEDGGHRKFILVQSPEPIAANPEKTIADLCVQRLDKASARYAQSFQTLR